MKLTILDNNKVIFESESVIDIVSNLMYYLYAKQVNRVKGITIKHKYNYTDKQTIRILDKRECLNKREYIFEGIPTKWGSLDTYEMLKEINNQM